MKKREPVNAFDIAAIIIVLAVAVFIAYALLSIVLGGLPFLPAAIASKEVRFAVGLSVYTASISTLLCVLLSVPSAYALTRTSMPLKKTIQIIMELPLSLPYLVLGLCLLIVFSSDLGKALRDMGFKVVFDKNGIILAQLIVNLPFAVKFMRTAMSEVDERLEFIAGTLGASRWTRFRTVLLPLCRQSVIAMVVLVWSRALGEFGATLMLVGVTRMKTETLPASIYLNISTGDNGMAMASAILIMIISAAAHTITTILNKKNRPLTRMRDTTT
ncbi:MAG: ABC transporter permease subunit [Clostridiales bacterium]|nr:ABC transporter permease subunit [Clostridiales bacterium]